MFTWRFPTRIISHREANKLPLHKHGKLIERLICLNCGYERGQFDERSEYCPIRIQ